MAEQPVSWKNGGKAATSSCSLLWLELESEVSLGVGNDGCSPLMCISMWHSLPFLGFASGW